MTHLFKLVKFDISTYNFAVKFPCMEYGGGPDLCLCSLFTQDIARKKFLLHKTRIAPF